MSERRPGDDQIGALLRSSLEEAPDSPFLDRKIWNAIEAKATKRQDRARITWIQSFSGALGVVIALALTFQGEGDRFETGRTEDEAGIFEITGLDTEAGETIVSFYENL